MEAVDIYENVAYGMVLVQVWLYFNLIYFYVKLVYSKAGYNEPIKG